MEPFRASTFARWVCLALVVLNAGCRTQTRLPGVDFSAAGWSLQRGQALWKPPQNRPEIAGDLLLATNRPGDYLVQFSKIPFPIVSVQAAAGRWQIEFGPNQRSRTGRGRPPKELVWVQLPRVLAGEAARPPWKFESLADGRWRLENKRSGERLEGAFFP